MEYAVIETGGKQYRVNPGLTIDVNSLKTDGKSVTFDKVLLYVDDKDVKIGKPYLEGASVAAKVVEALQGKKVRVSRFTAKSRHRRTVGFRAQLTRVTIEKITPASSKA